MTMLAKIAVGTISMPEEVNNTNETTLLYT